MTLLACTLVAAAAYLWMRLPVENRFRAYLPEARLSAVAAVRGTGRLARRRRESLMQQQSPGALTLLIALLDAGIPITDAVLATAESTAEPLGPVLREVAISLRWGATMQSAWVPLVTCEPWTPVIAAMERSARTGASLSTVLAHAAREMRAERRARATVAARKAGVRAILPLVICCMPAFLALGILPVIVAFMTPLIDSLR